MDRTSNVDAFRQLYSGGDLLEQSKAKPSGSLDWSQIESKLAASRSVQKTQPRARYDSDAYLRQSREEDPWPQEVQETAQAIGLSDCRFELPQAVCPDRQAMVSCQVSVPSDATGSEILFRLMVRRSQDADWTDLQESRSVAVPAAGKTDRVRCALTPHCPMPAPELGTEIQYKVEASSGETKVESPSATARVRIVCKTLAAPEISWKDRDMVPVLDEEGRWAFALSTLLGVHARTEGSTMVAFGHGNGAHARECGRLRAEWIRCLLARDAEGWEALRNKSTVKDVQSILSGLALAGGWNCHPGPVDGKSGKKTTGALLSFETECAKRLKARPKVDGTLDKQTWAGFLEALIGVIVGASPDKKEWALPTWGQGSGKGVYSNGADFPKDPGVGVELCVFLPGMTPKLEAPSSGKATIRQNPVEDPALCTKEPIVVPWMPPGSGWTRRVRMVGRTFDPNKGFLLPQSLPGIRKVVRMHKDFPEAKIVVVCHGESDEIHAGIGIARHRAEMIDAFLRSDVAPWLVCFGPSQYKVSRWGTRELQLMLSALGGGGRPYFEGLASGITDEKTTASIKSFQADHGLKVDGKPGPLTREALVKAYMGIEDTSLLADAAPMAIGCEGGEDPSLPQSGMVRDDRRVEVFFFEKSVRPYPSTDRLKGDAREYRSWIDSLVETRDFETHGIHVKVLDEKKHPMAGVEVVLAGPTEVRATTDQNGFAEFDDLKAGEYSLRAADPARVVAPVRIRYPTAKTISGKGG